jgi:hypothetical protein
MQSTNDPNFSAEMNRYRALELAIRSDFAEPPEKVVERARIYAEFMNDTQPQTV